jgi:hypothetical protein
MCRLLLPRLHNLAQSITRHPSSPDAPIFTLTAVAATDC